MHVYEKDVRNGVFFHRTYVQADTLDMLPVLLPNAEKRRQHEDKIKQRNKNKTR